MRYLLVIETDYHYDGHGEVAEGREFKYVVDDDGSDEEYSHIKEDVVYNSDTGEVFNEDGDYYPYDSYHYINTVLVIKEITKKEYNEYKHIFNQYNKIHI